MRICFLFSGLKTGSGFSEWSKARGKDLKITGSTCPNCNPMTRIWYPKIFKRKRTDHFFPSDVRIPTICRSVTNIGSWLRKSNLNQDAMHECLARFYYFTKRGIDQPHHRIMQQGWGQRTSVLIEGKKVRTTNPGQLQCQKIHVHYLKYQKVHLSSYVSVSSLGFSSCCSSS